MPQQSREISLYTLAGVKDAEVTTHYFETDDMLGLSLLRFRRGDSGDAIMIAHGLTTSTDMFIMPEHYNLVSYLLDHGFQDVWCLDFRMSNRHDYNMRRHRFTMDDVALYDMPAAITTVRKEVGESTNIHVIAHCLGSMSFAMSLFSGTVEGISSAVLNSVALTPRVPRWSAMKLRLSPLLVEYVLGLPYVNPRWSEDPGLTAGKIVSKFNSLVHRECNVPACHMLSLMWGSGHPALYSHENLEDVTHERGGDLYGPTSVHYYRHVGKMLRSGNTAIKYNPKDSRYDALPDNYMENAADLKTPVLFMTGDNNRVFTDSNIVCYQKLEELAPGRHQLQVFEGYGHQDVFMGKNNHVDVFPRIVEFLNENSSGIASGNSR